MRSNLKLGLRGFYLHSSPIKLDAYNLKLARQYKPLSYVYVVLNNRTLATLERQSEQSGIFKLTNLKQF